MNRTWSVTVLVPALLAVLAAGCGGTAPEDSFEQVEREPNVETYTVEPTEFRQYIHLPVVVSPNRTASLGLTNGGKVETLHVDKGDRVRAGQTLLATDTATIRANLASAEANLDYRRKEYERLTTLHEEGSITDAEYDAAELQLAQAKSTFEQAEEALDEATLTAPFSGVITERLVEEGEILSPGSPAFMLMETERMKVQTGIPEKYIYDFSTGNDVTITFDSLPDRTFNGVIDYLAPAANPAVRTFQAEMVVDNSDGVLRAGIMGDADILRYVHENALMIPLNAVIETQDGKIVYVVDDADVAHERYVTPGGTNDTLVHITKGLEPGETIVAQGQYNVADGDKVAITGDYTPLAVEGAGR